MKTNYLFLLFVFSSLLISCGDKQQHVLVETDFGNIKIMLFDQTPIHRDNFVKLVKEGFYDDLLFHRIIKGFMIQGGDPQSKDTPAGMRLGGGGPGYQIDAEIGAAHVAGALAAARTGGAGNPEKRSSGSQFYIIHGNPLSDAQIDSWQKRKNIIYSDSQRAAYRENGGRPDLDMEYTVFGRVVEGMDVVDKIANVKTAPGDRPLEDVKMKITLL